MTDKIRKLKTKAIEHIVSNLDIAAVLDSSEYDQETKDLILKYVDWNFLSSRDLPENLIEKYHDKVNWPILSKNLKLSEKFIEKNADKVDWCRISLFQHLSEDFIEKNIKKIYPLALAANENISVTFRAKKVLLVENDVNEYTDEILKEIELRIFRGSK